MLERVRFALTSVLAVMVLVLMGCGGQGERLAAAQDAGVDQLARIGVIANADWEPYTEVINGIEMALVPAGCFQMGSERGQADEEPIHEVCFTEPFWLNVYEVTNHLYAEFLNEEGNWETVNQWLDPASADVMVHRVDATWIADEGFEDHPMVVVTWQGATSYCKWRGARLPSEAEWEYAARGPDGPRYPWGEDFTCSLGNFDDEILEDIYSVQGGVGCDGFNRTAPVGSFATDQSWVGVYDLTGNVREWLADWYGLYPAEPQINPSGPTQGEFRVLRGGAWHNSHMTQLPSNNRYFWHPDFPTGQFGFRCALTYRP